MDDNDIITTSVEKKVMLSVKSTLLGLLCVLSLSWQIKYIQKMSAGRWRECVQKEQLQTDELEKKETRGRNICTGLFTPHYRQY